MKKDTRDSKARVAAHRARLREQGLRPIEVWAYPEHHQAIRDFATNVQRQPSLAVRPDAQAGKAEAEEALPE
jgi:DNA-directed RNA polymerase subunit K/omega